MYTNAVAILNQIKSILTTSVVITDLTISLDEPLDLIYSDLPSIAIYPLKEDLLYDEGYSQDKKQLSVRLELRMKSGPASTVCTPVVNTICSAIKANRTLGNLADYVEIQTIQWANDKTESGYVCGASVDIVINYLT